MEWPLISICKNEKMSGLIRIPVTQKDLHSGLHQFMFFLKRLPGFVGMDDEKLHSIVALGLGYKSFMDLKHGWSLGMTLDTLTKEFGRTAGAPCARLVHLGEGEDRESIRKINLQRGGHYGKDITNVE